jgi:hypothetical protein
MIWKLSFDYGSKKRNVSGTWLVGKRTSARENRSRGGANAESALRQAQKYRTEDSTVQCLWRPASWLRYVCRGEEIKPSPKLNALFTIRFCCRGQS